MTMFKMLMAAGLAALMLTLAVPQMTRAVDMERAESATLAQLTRATTPEALQALGSGDRLTELAHHLLALVGGSGEAPQLAPQAQRWVPVDEYVDAIATVQAPAAAP